MTKTYKLAFWLLLGAMFATLLILMQKPWQAYGNVSPDEVLQATVTPQVADLTNLCPQLNNVASSTTGTLGSVLVTGRAGTGGLVIYDATTTNATLRASSLATSTLYLADFPAGFATSTEFNLGFKYGLLIDYATGVSTSTITYRCGS